MYQSATVTPAAPGTEMTSQPMQERSSMQVRIKSIRWEAEGINAYRLEPLDGAHLPAFDPGAHIDVKLGANLARSYSLTNDPADRSHYEIAVHNAPNSRGGSRLIHDSWKAGDIVEISPPRNNFPMAESAGHTVLIAGGIGVTPMLPMIARLDALGRSWELHYVAHSSERAAYLDRLRGRDNVHIQFDGAEGAKRLDMAALITGADRDAYLYCCGPTGMLDAFVALTKNRPEGHARIEYFTANIEAALDGGYVLDLKRSGKLVEVEAGTSMLDALLDANVDIGFACSEGICGTCRVSVLEGVPDHRDQFLTDAEKAANRDVMVCCSGSRSQKLVLDL